MGKRGRDEGLVLGIVLNFREEILCKGRRLWNPRKFTFFDSLFIDYLVKIVTYFRCNECKFNYVFEDYEFVKNEWKEFTIFVIT